MNKYEKAFMQYQIDSSEYKVLTSHKYGSTTKEDESLLNELIERATPKKVLDLKPLQNLKGCPNCNSIINPLEYFCKKCGQALGSE